MLIRLLQRVMRRRSCVLLRVACLAALVAAAAPQADAPSCPPAAVVRTLAGAGVRGGTDGVGTGALLSSPGAVAASPGAAGGGVLWLADTGNHRLRRVDAATGAVVTLAGGGAPGFADGPPAGALFASPRGVAADDNGTVYVADTDNGRIRAVDAATGAVRTLAGSGLRFWSRDGAAAQAMLRAPAGLAWHAAASALYVADDTAVRLVSLPDGRVSTLAGGSVAGFADGVGAAARFSGASALALDDVAGVLYVADAGNAAVRVVALRSGAVSTLAGGGSAPLAAGAAAADGVGANATLAAPAGVAWLSAPGLLLVAEAGGNRLRLVNVTSGQVSTVAGGAAGAAGLADGVGVGALLHAPAGLSATSDGAAALLADAGNHALRRVELAASALFTLEVTAEGVADGAAAAGGVSATAGSYDILYRPGGAASDVGDVLTHAGEGHTLSWCAYDDVAGGGERADVGTLVLRGALSAALYAPGVSPATPLLTWRGDAATSARILPLALPRPGCTAPAAANYNPLATSEDGSCSPGYAATFTVAADDDATAVATLGAGYTLDGPGLHVDSDQFSGGPLAPGEAHSLNVTLRCGAVYNVRVFGAAAAVFAGAADGAVLWSGSGADGTPADGSVRAPAVGGCGDAASAAASAAAAAAPRGATVALSAAAAASAASWFSFGVYALGGAGGGVALDALAVAPPALFATAAATAVALPALSPGLYFVEYYGNVSGTVALLAPPPVAAAALRLDASAAAPNATADDAAASAPLAPLLLFSAAAQAAAGDALGAGAWGVPYVPLSALDPFGGRLAGGARRAYFAVPPRAGAAAPTAAALAPGLGGVLGDGDAAAAWIPPPAAAAAAALSVQPLKVALLAGMAPPPPALGRLVSAVHALTPLRGRFAAPVTLSVRYDAADAEGAPAGGEGVTAEAGLALLRASDAGGADWRVLPGAVFVGGAALADVAVGGVFAVALRAAVAALWPAYGDVAGGTRLGLAGASLAPSRFAACRFAAASAAASAAAYSPALPADVPMQAAAAAVAAASPPRAHLRCAAPRAQRPGWVAVEFFDAQSLSETRSGQLFLYLAPPRVTAVAPAWAAAAAAAAAAASPLVRLSGVRLAPPAGALQPWACTLAGGGDATSSATSYAHVFSSALAACEAPAAAAPGAFPLLLAPPADGADAGAFPDTSRTCHVALSYEPPLRAGPARGGAPATSLNADLALPPPPTRLWPHGGSLLLVPISAAGPAPGATAAAALRIGTISVAARPAPGGVLAAVAPAGGAHPGQSVPIALAGAPGVPDDVAGRLLSVAPPALLEAFPSAAALHGGGATLVAADVAPVVPTGAPELACVLDGVPSALAAASSVGDATWLCVPAPARIGFVALSLGARHASPAAAAAATPLLVFKPPRLRSAHPAAPPAPGGVLTWLSGAELAPPPGFGLRIACRFSRGSAADVSPGPLVACHVISSALAACEAPAAATPGGAQEALSVALEAELPSSWSSRSGDFAAAGGGAPLALGRPRAPTLRSAAPRAALDAHGGGLVTLRGVHLEAAALPLLACAFGAVAPVAPAWRAGGAALACAAPARAPGGPPVALALALPGRWRTDAAADVAVAYAPPTHAAALQAHQPAGGSTLGGGVLMLFGAPADVALPPGVAGAACRFFLPGGAASASVSAWRGAAAPGAQAGLTCASPPVGGAPRFVAVTLTWQQQQQQQPGGAGAAAAPPASPLRCVQFEYRSPPAPRAAYPEAVPPAGGVLVALSGRGFHPAGGTAWACAFRSSSMGGGRDTAGSAVGGVAHSSALLMCEAPPGAAAGELGAGGAELGGGALPLARAPPPAARAAAPRAGDARGGTLVLLRGSAFLAADVTTQCQFGTVRVAASVLNATALACASPGGAPGRVPLAAVALGWPGAAGVPAARQLAFAYY